VAGRAVRQIRVNVFLLRQEAGKAGWTDGFARRGSRARSLAPQSLSGNQSRSKNGSTRDDDERKRSARTARANALSTNRGGRPFVPWPTCSPRPAPACRPRTRSRLPWRSGSRSPAAVSSRRRRHPAAAGASHGSATSRTAAASTTRGRRMSPPRPPGMLAVHPEVRASPDTSKQLSGQ
jgi:hypothetical protein